MMADVDSVVAAAVAQTGLENFGDDSFREGLEVLLASLRDEARLNARGEGYIYASVVTALSQRLQVENWYRRHPEIDDVEIEVLLIGLGLPRTGSTALSRPCSRRTPATRYLRRWEASQPCPPPSTRVGPRSADPHGRGPPGRLAGARADRTHAPMERPTSMMLDFKSHLSKRLRRFRRTRRGWWTRRTSPRPTPTSVG